MNSMEARFTEFYRQRMGVHCYPNEFCVRTFLGKHPKLRLPQDYAGKSILDLGCGDGRNMILFHNCGMKIYGVEITAEICAMTMRRMQNYAIAAEICLGRNSAIPFPDNSFDFVCASSSLHYVDDNETFADNLAEVARVLKVDGYLVCAVPAFNRAGKNINMLAGAINLGGGLYKIVNDPEGLRNGIIFHLFATEEEIHKNFAPYFHGIVLGKIDDDYYGKFISSWLIVCRKR